MLRLYLPHRMQHLIGTVMFLTLPPWPTIALHFFTYTGLAGPPSVPIARIYLPDLEASIPFAISVKPTP